jgi:hypothetical protein
LNGRRQAIVINSSDGLLPGNFNHIRYTPQLADEAASSDAALPRI